FLQRQSGELARAGLLQRGLVHALEQLEQAAQRVVGQLAAPRLTSPDTLVIDEVEGHRRWSAGIPPMGTILAACTMAESSPALTHSCRNSEFRTTRTAGLRPNDTFETPRVV